MSTSGEQRVHENRPRYPGLKIPPTNLTPGFEDTAAIVRPWARPRRRHHHGLTTTMASSMPLTTLLAVNPVGWARSQMAFTLAFHIILVPLGVSWALMALIANYKGIKHDDADAMRLAQRWSKYMAVTFAVGAVTGTVLTFEFGLLWPQVHGPLRGRLRGPVRLRRACSSSPRPSSWPSTSSAGADVKPWTHFWPGVPLPISGILGSASVVAANAWMNYPSGLTLELGGQGHAGRPMSR